MGGKKLKDRAEGKTLDMDKFAEEWEKQINKYFNKKQEREK